MTDTKPDQQMIACVEEFCWEQMIKDPENLKTRVQTGWGTKTKEGLAACMIRIVEELQNRNKMTDDEIKKGP